MGEVVKYHNDFNKIRLPSLTAQEQNLLMGIICKIKGRPAGKDIVFTAQELLEFSTDNMSKAALFEMVESLKLKFFKADFTILVREGGCVGNITFNLFYKFGIYEDEVTHKMDRVELGVNPQFAYLVEDLTKNFTRFELAEFVGLGSKYTKNLYRLLKQFRNSGKCTIYQHRWQDFCEFMGIPKDYLPHHIDQRVLKPAIKELAAERNLFNCTRPIFDNLTYKKIKDPKGRGRGGKVIGIEFYFTPESDRTELIEQDKDLKSLDRQIKAELNNQGTKTDFWGRAVSDCTPYVGIYFNQKNRFDGGVDKCKIKDIHEAPDGSIVVQGYNIETQKDFKDLMVFDNLNHMKNSLKPYW